MNGSWKLARVAGIDIRVHWTFLLLVGWIGAEYFLDGGGMTAAAFGVALLLAVFFCVVLHELGHAFAARQFGIRTEDITLLPIGGIARLKRMPRQPLQELWIAVAGPLVNVAIAAVLLLGLLLFSDMRNLSPRNLGSVSLLGFTLSLLLTNLMLVAFNLLPAFPMDGGRMLRALLAMKFRYVRATQLAARIGQAMAVLMGLGALFVVNSPVLVLVAAFVFLAAGAEARQVRFQEAVRSTTVGDAMQTAFETLSADDSVQHAAERLLAGSQQDFPVADQNGLRGLLTRQRLVKVICDNGGWRSVGDVCEPVVHPALENMPLATALREMSEQRISSLPVVRGSEIVGLLTSENVSEMFLLRCTRDGTPLAGEPPSLSLEA